jgi:hypothetical protein
MMFLLEVGRGITELEGGAFVTVGGAAVVRGGVASVSGTVLIAVLSSDVLLPVSLRTGEEYSWECSL